tara:strand:+ start:81 stop:857 length:777 start_codon:yes stop_codon:yes gene_type:complete
MKKLLGIVVLGLLISFNVQSAGYIVKNNLYSNCDILTKKDQTSFKNVSLIKEKKIKWWDRRKEKSSGWKQSSFKVFIFKATFENNPEIEIRVNSEFKSKDKAEEQALEYGIMIGQLPNFLRKNVKTLTIHKGNKAWGGGNEDILIHTGDTMAKGECGEEVIMHESGHTSLDWSFDGSVSSTKWKKAAKADNKFISEYAKLYPDREDVAETINWWIAIRCKPNKISKSNHKEILEGIPNRLNYLDKQNFDMFPLVCSNK